MSGDVGTVAAQPAATETAKASEGAAQSRPVAKATVRDPFEVARREMKEKQRQRKLHLVNAPNGQPDTESEPTSPDETTLVPGQDDNGHDKDHDHDDETQEDVEKQKEASWAQKLRADLAKKTEEVKATIEREKKRDAEWGEAVRSAKYRLEDVSDERDHFKGLFEQASKHLIDSGMLDPLSVQYVMEQFTSRGLKRQLERGTSAQSDGAQSEMKAKHTSAIQSGIDGLVAKYPELDWKKNKDAAGFMRSLVKTYGANGFPPNMEAEARRWVLGWRAEQGQATAAKAAPQKQPRPESTTLARTPNSGRPPAKNDKGLAQALTKKQLIAEVQQRRALRQQR